MHQMATCEPISGSVSRVHMPREASRCSLVRNRGTYHAAQQGAAHDACERGENSYGFVRFVHGGRGAGVVGRA